MRIGDWEIKEYIMLYIEHINCPRHGEYPTGRFGDPQCYRCGEKIPDRIMKLYKLMTL